jgi:hypothetical protein
VWGATSPARTLNMLSARGDMPEGC